MRGQSEPRPKVIYRYDVQIFETSATPSKGTGGEKEVVLLCMRMSHVVINNNAHSLQAAFLNLCIHTGRNSFTTGGLGCNFLHWVST